MAQMIGLLLIDGLAQVVYHDEHAVRQRVLQVGHVALEAANALVLLLTLGLLRLILLKQLLNERIELAVVVLRLSIRVRHIIILLHPFSELVAHERLMRHVLLVVATKMLARFNVYTQVLFVAEAAADHGLLAIVSQMEVDLFAELYLLALRARHTFPRTVVLYMPLQLLWSELDLLGALVRAVRQPRITRLIQMLVNLLVEERLLTAVWMVRALELQREQLLFE